MGFLDYIAKQNACRACSRLRGFHAGFHIASFNVDESLAAADGISPAQMGYRMAEEAIILRCVRLWYYTRGDVRWWIRGKRFRKLGLGCGYGLWSPVWGVL